MICEELTSTGTFRDPAGTLWHDDERIYRKVHPAFAAQTAEFLASDLCHRWMQQGRLVRTRLLEQSEAIGLILEHERVFFPSYSWEWCRGQWAAAAGLTLDLCEELLGHGLILKDATPLNILFQGSQPVFVDLLSIEPRDLNSPLWLAYGQFVRTFLLPLAAHKYLGWPLAASLQKRDGYEPIDLYPFLGLRQRWLTPCRSLVTLPFLLEGKTSATAKPELSQDPELAAAVLRRTLHGLRRALRHLEGGAKHSRWSDYPQSASHYSAEDHARKQSFVERALSLVQPSTALDLGANTGHYSRLAAAAGASVVAWDTDLEASERNWQEAQRSGAPILPLIADTARPTPAAGWRNSETLSLLERATRRFDCVLALGLMHHLLLVDQVPLPRIAGLLRELSAGWVIAEWIPATDIKFRELCRGRDNLYGHLDESAFRSAFEAHFTVESREELGNHRVLFLLKAQ